MGILQWPLMTDEYRARCNDTSQGTSVVIRYESPPMPLSPS